MIGYYVIFGVFMLASMIVGGVLKRKFAQYSKVLNVIFIAMFLGVFAVQGLFSIQAALLVIIACYGVFTLFAFITLPVEIDASKRALAWLSNSGITNRVNHPQAKDALFWLKQIKNP